MSPKLLNILLIMTSLVLYFYVVKPLYTGSDSGIWTPGENSIQGLVEKRDRYENTLKEVDLLVKKANTLKGEYDSFDANLLQDILIMVPDSVNNLKLLSEITKIAVDNNFIIEDLSVKDKGSGEYTITFSMNATYKQFKELIKFYERSKRLLSLQLVNFSPVKDDNEKTKFTIEFYTYYLK